MLFRAGRQSLVKGNLFWGNKLLQENRAFQLSMPTTRQRHGNIPSQDGCYVPGITENVCLLFQRHQGNSSAITSFHWVIYYSLRKGTVKIIQSVSHSPSLWTQFLSGGWKQGGKSCKLSEASQRWDESPMGTYPRGWLCTSKCSDFQAWSTFTWQGRLEEAVTFTQLWAISINETQLGHSWYTQPVCDVGRAHTGICKGTISCLHEIRHEVQSWFSR